MGNTSSERRLAAVLAADVVGYSRLVRADEEGTIARIKALHTELIDPKLAEHRGRIVKLMGDGMLAEFASVVDAVRAACDFQHAMTERNAGEPADRRIVLRIGINLGDVVIDGDDIHGDDVNIAARLEGIAPPGGICVSGGAYEQVRDRLDIAFTDIGEQAVKNIDRPVRVYTIGAVGENSDVAGASEAAATTLKQFSQPGKTLPSVLDNLFSGRAAVAVLPFRCLSGTDDDLFFADGITEDVVNGLAVWRWFPVIGRHTTNHFRDLQSAPNAVSNETGARYIIDGSVRRSGAHLRVTAELCDAASGQQLWSRRFDGKADDVFEIQDEISDEIARRVEPEIRRAESKRLYRQKPSELSVWELLHKARVTKFKSGHAYGTSEDNVTAMVMFRDVAARDPSSSDAVSGIATCHWHDAINSWSADPAKSGEAALRRAKEAVALDSTNYTALGTVSIIQIFGQHDISAGEVTARKSLEMNPSDILTRHYLVCSLEFGGKFDEAVEQCEYMMALDPRAPALSVLYGDLSTCLLLGGNAAKAVEYSRKSMEADPNYSRGRQRFIAALVAAGEMTEAKHEYAKLRDAMPAFNLDYVKRTYPFVHEQHLLTYSRYFAEVGVQ